MSSSSALLAQLIDALRCLPGIGPRSASRIAYHLLGRDRDGARRLSDALRDAAERVGHCERCRNFSETPLRPVCSDARRSGDTLCVVENPAQLAAIDQATHFRGVYHVLMGRLSPLDGIGPEELGLDRLEERLREGQVRELIIAVSATVEGEVTAHYLNEMARALNIRVTRLAQGVPMGGELEALDSGTLTQAFELRRDY
ncbi:recombination mediator RecR [Acidihalobacter ferrooxydans]|uniref:Recombination protein RecR n=1 Tax=Acidihalobacter ferrooxydans TaxID=1765967 RepID=A0A1P8UGB6_9GAMM|nr:recombination mediator RecR [Acidihalobacter ferrooxydans]APZ42865.1 recombination protein RecR [Acidihalobacter ferrooxydans]